MDRSIPCSFGRAWKQLPHKLVVTGPCQLAVIGRLDQTAILRVEPWRVLKGATVEKKI
jgi:hypothetical protein